MWFMTWHGMTWHGMAYGTSIPPLPTCQAVVVDYALSEVLLRESREKRELLGLQEHLTTDQVGGCWACAVGRGGRVLRMCGWGMWGSWQLAWTGHDMQRVRLPPTMYGVLPLYHVVISEGRWQAGFESLMPAQCLHLPQVIASAAQVTGGSSTCHVMCLLTHNGSAGVCEWGARKPKPNTCPNRSCPSQLSLWPFACRRSWTQPSHT